MGQYYKIINIDKEEYLDPLTFGDGSKLMEFAPRGDILSGLAILTASGNGRGGGDLHCEDKIIGSWAGDRIVTAGDYADKGLFVPKKYLIKKLEKDEEQPTLYTCANKFKEVSLQTIYALLGDLWLCGEWKTERVSEAVKELILIRETKEKLPLLIGKLKVPEVIKLYQQILQGNI